MEERARAASLSVDAEAFSAEAVPLLRRGQTVVTMYLLGRWPGGIWTE